MLKIVINQLESISTVSRFDICLIGAFFARGSLVFWGGVWCEVLGLRGLGRKFLVQMATAMATQHSAVAASFASKLPASIIAVHRHPVALGFQSAT
jgi:hypothetical protein